MSPRDPIPFTLDGALYGARKMIPLVLSSIVFGAVYGVLARDAGLSLAETVLMSATVFAGASQLIAIQLWAAPLPVLPILIATLAVNSRMLLMGASMRPWFTRISTKQAYGSFFFLTDGNWAMAMKEYFNGYRDAAFLLGSGLALYVGWVASAAIGYGMGSMVGDPRVYGLDVLLPIFFGALLAAMWKGKGDLLPWGVAAGTAILASYLVPGHWYILIGGFVGSLTGLLRYKEGDHVN
ncbi:AzlC family ABC transporter permease [Oceanibaculum pacificum]|uniref:Branched-chain amino acid ABC transporter permease n=1 Tax=Oceanibaculum pacificum TaxID=580166 RepID=A0A154VVT5_9PROT|nr:AzlC family ABC transporter permease [Oceanibaculum pacificum]KZD05393.1 branched-chain amino acid ABC transporter permease [Oceanibaculum pacificum]